MLMHAIALGGCTDSVRESALEAEGKKRKENILAAPGIRTRVSIAPWLFIRTLYQLSCPRPFSHLVAYRDFHFIIFIIVTRKLL